MSEARETPVTAEQVAALLEGRLTGEERARVLRLVGGDPEWRDVAFETIGVAAENAQVLSGLSSAYDETAASATIPRAWSRTGWALAASLFAAVALGGVWWRNASRSPVLAPLMDVAVQERAAGRQFDGPLLALRGSGASAEMISARARSVAIGAMSAALVSTRAQSDSAAADVVLNDLLAALRDVPGTAPEAAILTRASNAHETAVAATALRVRTDSSAFDAGVYLQLRRSGDGVVISRTPVVRSWLEQRASEDASLAPMIERLLRDPAPVLADSVLQVLVRVR